MALNIDNPEHSYRPVGFAVAGVFIDGVRVLSPMILLNVSPMQS